MSRSESNNDPQDAEDCGAARGCHAGLAVRLRLDDPLP